MSVLHIADGTFIPTGSREVLRRLEHKLAALLKDESIEEDFERFERALSAVFNAAQCEVLGEALQRQDVNVATVSVDGRVHRRVLRSEKTYQSAAGPVTVLRTLYRAGKGERSVAVLEPRAGIVQGQWTPLAARHAAMLVAHLTPQESEGVLRELGAMVASKSSLDRLAKVLSGRWEAQREPFEAALRDAYEVPSEARTVAVSLDGVMVPMKDAAGADKREKNRAGAGTRTSNGYQEAGCATLTLYDEYGERVDTVRLARMPESKKVTLKQALAAELESVLRQRPELNVVKLADGAPDNWRFLTDELPEGQEFIDFYHASSHLKDAFDAAHGEGTVRSRERFEKYRHILRHDIGGVEKVIRALNYQRSIHPRRQRLVQVLGYFRRHRRRMNYALAKLCRLPIGSGVVEAACKTLATQRLKRSGMRWRHRGGQAILTFRALIQSARFDNAWDMLSATYRASVTVPDNVLPFPFTAQ